MNVNICNLCFENISNDLIINLIVFNVNIITFVQYIKIKTIVKPTEHNLIKKKFKLSKCQYYPKMLNMYGFNKCILSDW